MKHLITGLLVMAVSTANAAFVPATDVRGAMAPTRNIDVRARVANEIQARAAMGYHYASVDMDGATWKEEKQIMKELQAKGYLVEFGNDQHVYGWNSLNGALIIRWVPRSEESLFADR